MRALSRLKGATRESTKEIMSLLASSTAEAIAGYLKEQIKEFLEKYRGMSGDRIAAQRYERFRKF